MTNDDLYYIARHLVDNMDTLFSNYVEAKTPVGIKEYIQARTATDLNHKYTSRQIQEAFESTKIKTLMEFYLMEDDYDKKNSIH
jgi:hypothetical protein